MKDENIRCNTISGETVATNPRVSNLSPNRHCGFDICVTVHHWYNNINNQLDATITVFINNPYQLNMFRAMISLILRSTRLCLQLVV